MINRRTFVSSAALAATALVSPRLLSRSAGAATPKLTPFVDPLPIPATLSPTGTYSEAGRGTGPLYDLPVSEIRHRFHRDLPYTNLWGYRGAYPGPTIMATAGKPLFVRYANTLQNKPHPLWSDAFACMHGPDMSDPPSARRLVTHLHGGRVAPDSDGNPEETLLPGQKTARPYWYPNIQSAATLWYHDHALGNTRLNVMMGLSGFYLISDPYEQTLALPRGAYDIPLSIHDRTLNADGSLNYPRTRVPEFFGDTMVVNGKIAPYHNVHRGKYRLRLLNSSNSRFLILALGDKSVFWQIASEQGLLPKPLAMAEITLAPGERAEIVVDFAPYGAGKTLALTNACAPAPYPMGGRLAVPEAILQFRVQSSFGFNQALPAVLRQTANTYIDRSTTWSTVEVLAASSNTRRFTLEEAMPPGSPGFTHPDVDPDCLNDAGFLAVINDPATNTIMWSDRAAAIPFGRVEVWELVNNTVDAHPMHLHLTQFQVIARQGDSAPSAEGPGIWKDTVIVPPGKSVKVVARFDGFRGRYPFHCHILEHEDHEMMRFFEVV